MPPYTAVIWDVGPGVRISRDSSSVTLTSEKMSLSKALYGIVCQRDENIAGPFLGLHPANEIRRYKITPSLIGWAQT